MTLKTVQGLKWTSIYCHNAKFILKIDDDVVPDIYKLMEYLNNVNETKLAQNNIFGLTLYSTVPMRTGKFRLNTFLFDTVNIV